MQTEKETLSKIVNVRMTEADHATLKQKSQAEGISMSDYLRLQITAVNARPTQIPTPDRGKKRDRPYHPADPKLIAQLAWIGSNINQIAHQANKQGSLPLLIELASIEQQLKRILDNAA